MTIYYYYYYYYCVDHIFLARHHFKVKPRSQWKMICICRYLTCWMTNLGFVPAHLL